MILRNKEWLWLAVEHISKKIPDEDRNLIKKGWDQMYRDPMREEGFLSRVRETRAGWQEAHKEVIQWFVTHSIVYMTHCICFVDACTVKCT